MRCGLRKIIHYARATSAAAAAAAAAADALPLLLGVCDLCCTAVMRRLSIDATGGRCAVPGMCVGRDMRFACAAPKHKACSHFFSRTGRICSRKRTEH